MRRLSSFNFRNVREYIYISLSPIQIYSSLIPLFPSDFRIENRDRKERSKVYRENGKARNAPFNSGRENSRRLRRAIKKERGGMERSSYVRGQESNFKSVARASNTLGLNVTRSEHTFHSTETSRLERSSLSIESFEHSFDYF